MRRYGLPRRLAKAAPAILIAALLWAAPARSAEPKLLVFGDSLAAGYGLPHDQGFESQLEAALSQAGHPVQILDGGVSGDTTAGGRARLDWALADNPDAVIVELGGNDGLRGIDPATMQANLAAILDTLAARHLPVLLAGMLAPPNLGDAYGTQFRAVFQLLGKRPGLIFDPFFLVGVAGDPALNQADRIHPNPQGVRIIVARLLPTVERLLTDEKARPRALPLDPAGVSGPRTP